MRWGETTVQLHAAERTAMLPDLDGNPHPAWPPTGTFGDSSPVRIPAKRDQWFMPLISVRLVRPGTGCSE